MRASAVRDNCVITLSVANVRKTLKQVNIHKAAGPDGLPGCLLASVFNDIFKFSIWVCKTNMFQADHHSPCVQEHQGNLPKWLANRNTRLYPWSAIQHHYPRNPRPTPICILPKQIYRWCNLYCTPHFPFPPGQKEHLRENYIHWQLIVQHHSALRAHH